MRINLLKAKEEFENKIAACYLKVGHKLGLPWQPIRITFDLKGVVGGRAWGSMNLIQINPGFVDTDHWEDLLHQTIPHEYAHILAHKKYTHRVGHGSEWKYIMRLMGLEPRRCHNYDLSKVIKVIEYKCSCQVHQYSTRRHAQVVKYGTRYICRMCKTTIERVVR